jgi:hypothetical protein
MDDTNTAPQSRLLTAVSTAYLLFALAFAAHASYLALRDHFTVPHWDDWRILDDFFSAPDPKWWIFKDQVGHRLPVTLLLLYLDYTFLSGRMHLLVAAAVACAWLAALAFRAALRAGTELSPSGRRVALGFVVFCLFWSGASFDFPWGINQGTQLGRMWFAVSLALALEYRRRLGRGERVAGLPVAVGSTAVLATFSQGLGACTWPALVAMSMLGRFPRKVALGFLLAGAASVLIYGSGLQGGIPFGSYQSYTRLLMQRPLTLFQFAAAFVGAPVAHVAGGWEWIVEEDFWTVATWVGIGGSAALLVYVVTLLLRAAAPRGHDLLAVGLMVFGLAGGILVGFNRAAFPSTAVSVRFHSWTVLFWIGAALAAASLAGASKGGRALAVVMAWVLPLVMFPALGEQRRHHALVRQMANVEAAMHLSQVRWDLYVGVGTKSLPERAYRVVERLRADRRSVFSGARAALLGSRLEERFPDGGDSDCGSIRVVRRVQARESAAMARGSMEPALLPGVPSFVVLADAAGRINGLGSFEPLAPAERRQAPPAPARSGVEWVGFINGFDEAQAYAAHAIVDEGRSRCRLGTWRGGGVRPGRAG